MKWILSAIMFTAILFAVACSNDDGGSGLVGTTCTTEGVMVCDDNAHILKCEGGVWKDLFDCASVSKACVEVLDVAACGFTGIYPGPVTGSDSVNERVTDTCPDTGTDTGTDTDTVATCGNGITDSGEVCDGGAKNCTELGGGYTGGFATCKSDCSGWDTTNCTSGSDTDTVPDTDTGTGDKSCSEINSCMGDCTSGDQTCYQACYDAGSADGKAKFDALMSCIETNCANECGSSGTTESCNTCADTNCSDQLDACFINENAPVYGTVNANNTAFNYIYDGDGDLNTQIQSNMSGVVMQAVFTGTYTASNKPIPPAGASQNLALAMHVAADGSSPASIIVMQQSASGQSIVNPIVQLMFPSDQITPGQYDMDPTKQGSAALVLANAVGQSACLLAYCFSGTTNVTAAVNTTQTSGGSITFGVTNAKVYYPTETPIGDISGQLSGAQICPKE